MATNNQLNVGLSGQSGSGAFAGSVSPSFTTPSLGIASATSINKVALTAPATGSTLTIADGKTLTVNNTLTFSGTDSAAVNFGAGGTVAYGSASLTWSGVSGTSQAAAVNNGYIIQNAGQTTVTLPLTAAIGDRVSVAGLGAAGWILAANTGQTIKLGSSTTSSGGSLTSSNLYDQIEVICVVANTTWATRFAFSAGLTIA